MNYSKKDFKGFALMGKNAENMIKTMQREIEEQKGIITPERGDE